MHIASLIKILCYLLKLSSGNDNMGVSRADNSVKVWRNLSIINPKPDLYNINAHTKFGENPLMFTQVSIRKRKTDGRTYDGRTDTDVQGETIIPRHYCVAGFKKVKLFLLEIQNDLHGRQFKNLLRTSSETQGHSNPNLVGSIRVTYISKLAKIIPIGNPRRPHLENLFLYFFSWTDRPVDSKRGRRYLSDL